MHPHHSPPTLNTEQAAEQPGFWPLLREDIRYNGGLTRPGARALIAYRLGARAARIKAPLWGSIARRLALSLQRYVRNAYGIELYPTATIGRRLIIGHQNGIVIHAYAQIGDDCVIHPGVTMTTARISAPASLDNAPTLGDRVDLGPGVTIMGGVTVGDDVRAYPNAVILSDVPAGSTVVGPMSRMFPPKP